MDMVTYKSLQMFEREGITYLGIPEDMIIDFLNAVVDTTKIKNEKWKQVLVEKLGIIAAVKDELDSTLADVIDSTMMEQIMESEKKTTERAAWVKNPVPYIARSQYYRYTNDSLNDLNLKLKITYRLAWVYKIMSQRHPGIEMKFEHLTGKTSGGKTIIMIPKALVDATKQTIIDSMSMYATGLNPSDTLPEATKPITTQAKQATKPLVMETNGSITEEQKEISELVLAVLQMDKQMSMSSLKRKCEQHMDSNTITIDAFREIIRNLEKCNFIAIDGSTVILK